MAAVPSIGRATRVETPVPREASATQELYGRYGNQIFRYCLNQLGSREEAEDALQSTFLNAFRGLSRGIVPEAEAAWLFKIAENVCLSRRRSSWRRGRIESAADFEIVEELAPAPARRADELIGLQDVLEQMPENQRRAILLREWQGLSYREIGQELELSQGAVETLIFRARRSLAKGLEASPAEQRSWRARVRSSVDLGSLVGAVKSLLATGAVAKLGTAAAVVAVTSVAATAPAVQPHHHARGPKTQPAAPADVAVAATKRLLAPADVVATAPAVAHPASVPAAPAHVRHAVAAGTRSEVGTPPTAVAIVAQPPVAAAAPTEQSPALTPPQEAPPAPASHDVAPAPASHDVAPAPQPKAQETPKQPDHGSAGDEQTQKGDGQHSGAAATQQPVQTQDKHESKHEQGQASGAAGAQPQPASDAQRKQNNGGDQQNAGSNHGQERRSSGARSDLSTPSAASGAAPSTDAPQPAAPEPPAVSSPQPVSASSGDHGNGNRDNGNGGGNGQENDH